LLEAMARAWQLCCPFSTFALRAGSLPSRATWEQKKHRRHCNKPHHPFWSMVCSTCEKASQNQTLKTHRFYIERLINTNQEDPIYPS